MTDANGAANFTQQFAVNGQRGTATVFALDGFDTTDPEMGGATFSNFNVDAIQEVQASSGVMPAGDRARRRQLHQCRHQVRHQPGARQLLRICPQRRLRCAQLFRSQERRRRAPHSSLCPQRIRLYQRRPGGASEDLRRPRPHFLFRPVPGLPPGAGHHAGVSRPHRRRAPGHRHRDFSRRHADRAGEPGHRAGARSLSLAQRSDREPTAIALTPLLRKFTPAPTSFRCASTTTFPTRPRC